MIAFSSPEDGTSANLFRVSLVGLLTVSLAAVLYPFPLLAVSQAREQEAPEPPPFQLLRAEEDYGHLRYESRDRRGFLALIKFIQVNQDGSIYLTAGGEVRPRVEVFENRGWTEGSEAFYSQRLAVYAGLRLGSTFRIFGELYHGLLSKDERETAQDDELDVHQAFLEITIPTSRSYRLEMRLGRQELTYGSSRLFGLREGPNIRRTFDAARLRVRGSNLTIDAFVGSEVRPRFSVFDNTRDREMLVWGGFTRFRLLPIAGATEAYYFGFDVDEAHFEEGTAPETRHSFGLRRFGSIGEAFRFNTEIILQLGTFGDQSIRALAVETDYMYKIVGLPLRPALGIKLDYIGGDGRLGDDRLGTFNPLFPNPAYFGLLGQLTPMNLIDVHPSVRFELNKTTELTIDWDFFWRARLEDGIYSPPRFLLREGQPAESRFIGHQPGFEIVSRFSRHVTWSTEASLFAAGAFLDETGEAENILHAATTLSFKF